MNRMMIPLAVAALLTAAPSTAQDGHTAPRRMVDYVVNAPEVRNWNSWGVTPAPVPRRAEGVAGGQALRIAAQRGGQPWDVGAVMQNPSTVRAGDVVFVAVWVRHAEGNAEPARLPLLAFEGQAAEGDDAPQITLARAENVRVGRDWGMVYALGTAPTDFAAGRTKVVVLLGAEGQTFEVGPALLYDFGPGFDASLLPRNPVD